MATSYIVGRVENNEYGVAIAYSTVLIVVMLVVIGLMQLARRQPRHRPARQRRSGARRHADQRQPAAARRGDRRSGLTWPRSRSNAASVEFRPRHQGLRRHRARGRRRLASRSSAGTLVTLLGPSGCGKTTTLRMIAGLEMATSGPDPDRRRRRHAACRRPTATCRMVFQSYALFPHMTVMENVAYGLHFSGFGKKRDRRPRRRRARTGRPRRLRRPRCPSELSGGQQQRVAVARALVLEPQVLLFDEPLSNLDAKLRRRVREEIRELQQKLGLTVVYVTHDQEEALAVSDRIIVMNNAVDRPGRHAARALRRAGQRLRRRLHRRGQHPSMRDRHRWTTASPRCAPARSRSTCRPAGYHPDPPASRSARIASRLSATPPTRSPASSPRPPTREATPRSSLRRSPANCSSCPLTPLLRLPLGPRFTSAYQRPDRSCSLPESGRGSRARVLLRMTACCLISRSRESQRMTGIRPSRRWGVPSRPTTINANACQSPAPISAKSFDTVSQPTQARKELSFRHAGEAEDEPWGTWAYAIVAEWIAMDPRRDRAS